jgi:arylformamidase
MTDVNEQTGPAEGGSHGVPQFNEIVDLSHELYEGMPNIGGNPVSFGAIYTYDFTGEMSQGRCVMQGQQILMPEHCATHLDAPRHFDPDGLSTADYPLDRLVLPGHLLDLRAKGPREAITVDDLKRAEQRSGREIGPGTATIVWTGADRRWGTEGFTTERPFVPVPTAGWLIERDITLFATDLIGMDDPDEWWWPTHAAWLRAGIPMCQQLCNLNRLVGRDFVFVALPLKIRNGTGCPVRAVALVV